ncbi:signal peptidase I [Dellaglioa algida]|uniref:signal peptidase I n=1 Tax=Dellaglioa algida TaxID=105612 RepID=UPI0024C4AD2B|nr:signal peptidase I [Dellaglioa algida]MDK1726772.1 signal peptidase I [Dellaglioa algida]MDK1728515.1 signal peptidase I [Dellaglioa algida]MDK1736081.1 signal peptidase I [Dellaglioa algida]MDK1737880.1 signal peptidase I [Dellaglioa algida]
MKRIGKEIMSWIIPIAVGLIIAMLLKTFVVTMVRVDGPSMQPNLVNNEHVAVVKVIDIKRYSTVVFDAYGVDPDATDGQEYVKRVIGMPGDTVAFKNEHVYVNDKEISEPYISNYQKTKGTRVQGINAKDWSFKSLAMDNQWTKDSSVTKVPAGKYFVLGDHRSVSNDSRYWGFVDKSKIQGVVKVPFWNLNKSEHKYIY